MSSKRRIRNKSCTGKIKYDEIGLAYAARRRLTRQKSNDQYNVYKCQFCKKYHVGHTSGGIRT